MISVTAAANSFRRVSTSSISHRPSFGANFKAFGSGRIALSSAIIEEKENGDNFEIDDSKLSSKQNSKKKNSFRTFHSTISFVYKLFLKIVEIFLSVLSTITFHFQYGSCYTVSTMALLNTDSAFYKLNEKTLFNVFGRLHANDLMAAKFACRKFRKFIDSNANNLAKFQIDQIKLHFDEGEIIIYPLDERVVPIRRPMPTVEHLSATLRHICTLSLFVRGLIPMETGPVLKRLSRLCLSPQQIYFLWCDFDENAEHYLKQLLRVNGPTLTDLGFEVCGPPQVISDSLLRESLPRLSSIRVWNERGSRAYRDAISADCERNEHYAITDRTLLELAKIYASDYGRLEVVDLASVECTVDGVMALVAAWWQRPKANLSVGFHNCSAHCSYQLSVDDQCAELIERCAARDIPLTRLGVTHPRGFRLSLHLT